VAFGIIGRRRELGAIDELLDQAAAGTGGLLVLTGPAGSGRTALAEAAADRAAQRGFEVIRLPAGAGEQGSTLWARIRPELRGGAADPGAHRIGAADPGGQRGGGPAGAGSPLATGGGLAAGDGSAATGSVAGGAADTQDADALVAALADGVRRLMLVDDADQGAAAGIALIRGLARGLAGSSTAVLATTGPGSGGLTGLAGRAGLAEPAGPPGLAGLAGPPGLAGLAGRGRGLALEPLNPHEIGELAGVTTEAAQYALWAASGGRPGPARALTATLAGLPPDADPVVHLALTVDSAEPFLTVDTRLVRLIEAALDRGPAAPQRARLLARLAHALLGDASQAARRRELIAEALPLARDSADPAVLAEVLNARLHALWDPAGAQDRLESAAEIIAAARGSADLARERSGLFWRFVALMELGRVTEAESALAAFEHEARLAGDAADQIMALARHAMLATIRGRFAEAEALASRVAEQGAAIQLPDTPALTGTLRGSLAALRGDGTLGEADIQVIRQAAQQSPGHFYEATAARVLLATGRRGEAGAELARALPVVLAGAGPRWVGAAADLSLVAAVTGDTEAARALWQALSGYRGQLVVWAGANTVTGQVSHYLGLLATQLGDLDAAADLLAEAINQDRQIGALPWLAQDLTARADLLDRRGRSDDAATASGHRDEAHALATQLGITTPPTQLTPPPAAGVPDRTDGPARPAALNRSDGPVGRAEPGDSHGLARSPAPGGTSEWATSHGSAGPGDSGGPVTSYAPAGPAEQAGSGGAGGAGGPAGGWTLIRDGDDWLLQAGPERARLRDSRGLHYLRALLAAPGQEIAALDLAAGGTGLGGQAAEPILDATAVRAYRRRLAELDADLDAADRSGDAERAARA
jgi:tetratricopeptide (TPR) repeat protein